VKSLALLETAMKCLQNKRNASRYLLETALHHRVKHKSLKKSCICSTNSWWQSCAELLW